MTSSTTWPKSDQRAATVTDLRILIGRGHNVTDAARILDVPPRTAYRWLGLERGSASVDVVLEAVLYLVLAAVVLAWWFG